MRIRKLGLKRYGLFTDAMIDFGPRAEGESDLHIVYGPNEAGKSTAMSAITDLMFGIGERSRFNFLHPYSTMRIEAEIELPDGVLRLSRIKRPQNSLLDATDQPIPDATLLGSLGGLEHATYKTMFCLDDETLEAGGESILASKGDLGQLLFSATAGLADLSQKLDGAKADADAFFRHGKRSGELIDLKKELAVLKEKRERIDTFASDYARLTIERDEAAASYDAMLAQRSLTRARIDELAALISALPRLAALRGLREDLQPLAGLPAVPASWADDISGMITRETQLTTQAQIAADTMATLSTALDRLVVDNNACVLESQIDVLTDLRARHITAEKDLPDRRLRHDAVAQSVSAILKRIGRQTSDDPQQLILKTDVTGPLRDLMERRSGIEAASNVARDELVQAKDALMAAETKVGEVGGEPDAAALQALAAIIATARNGDDASRCRAASRLRQEREAELADRVLDLHPWTGDPAMLVTLIVPGDDRIEAWASIDAETNQTLALQRAERDRLAREVGVLDARVAALGSAIGAGRDVQDGAARSDRDVAWSTHKDTLTAETATVFEAAMRRDDRAMEQRLSHMAGLAELDRAVIECAGMKAALDHESRAAQQTMDRRAALAKEIAQSVRAIGGGADEAMGHAGLRSWLNKRRLAVDARGKLLAAERELQQAKSDAAAIGARVAQALRAANVGFADGDDTSTLLVVGQGALDRATAATGLLQIVEKCRRDLTSRKRKLDEALKAESAWQHAWRTACATCWLGNGETVPTIAIVRETLAALVELEPAVEKHAELRDRIAKMERDQSLFLSEVGRLADIIGLSATPSDGLALCQAVIDSVTDATETSKRRADVQRRLSAEQAQARTIADELRLLDAKKKQMTDLFGVESLVAVDQCLRRVVRKNDLIQRLDVTETEILDGLGLERIEDAETKLHGVERGALQAEHEQQNGRIDDEDRRIQTLFSLRSNAEDRINAVGGDAAVAAIDEQRRTVLLAIEDRAVAYLRLRLGAAAADKALRAYRDRHRSSMMARASDAFSLISRGRYSGLATQPTKDSEILIAKASDGGSKIASELSKGTRFQLYLALRVAGFYEFARAQAPAPFLADDIMETFDDFRAEEAFRLLAGMSSVGQVVYFTHHRHLCEIAKTVEPNVRIHQLWQHDRAVRDDEFAQPTVRQ